MAERVLNAFWILFGAAAAAHAYTLGIVGGSGPESGLFPLIAGLMVMGFGAVLYARAATRAAAPDFAQSAGLRRIGGIVLGLALMALALPHAGFAVTGVLTMLILVRIAGGVGWAGSIALALGSVALVIWLFGHVLGMALPRGPWGW